MSSKTAPTKSEVLVLSQHTSKMSLKDAPKRGRRSRLNLKITSFLHSFTSKRKTPPNDEKVKPYLPPEILDIIWNYILDWHLAQRREVTYRLHPIARIWQYRENVGLLPSLNTCQRSRQLALKKFPIVFDSYESYAFAKFRRRWLCLRNEARMTGVYVKPGETLYLQGSPYGYQMGTWVENLRDRAQAANVTVVKIDIGGIPITHGDLPTYWLVYGFGRMFAQCILRYFPRWKKLVFQLRKKRTFDHIIQMTSNPRLTIWRPWSKEANFLFGVCEVLGRFSKEDSRKMLHASVSEEDNTISLFYDVVKL